MRNESNRRSFLQTAALAGGAGVASSKTAHAQTYNISTNDLIRVGVLCLSPVSHAGMWASAINSEGQEGWVPRAHKLRVTHCWDSKPGVAEKFGERYNCTAVKNYYDMVGKVDAVILAGFYEAKWWLELARPYLEAGLPCYINRPFAMSMKQAKETVELAKKHNAPLLHTDGHLVLQEAKQAREKVKRCLREGKNIIGATAYNYAWPDYPVHTIHGLYFLYTVLGLDVDQISFQADGWWNSEIPTNPNIMTWGVVNLKYNGINIEGVGEQTEPFVATQLQVDDECSFSNIRLYYSDGGPSRGEWMDFDNQLGALARAGRGERMYNLNYLTPWYIQEMFTTRVMRWSYDEILQHTKIFLAGFKSHLDHNGAMYTVDDLPDDWKHRLYSRTISMRPCSDKSLIFTEKNKG
ncbi:Gfo/Idh/MocA family oxidoreductase [Candidatus Latescibacterota bacterium]